jgi:type II pantothenate kinase
MQAMFLRHEGFLGAVGAFLKVHPMSVSGAPAAAEGTGAREQRKVRAKFKERFVMGAPFSGEWGCCCCRGVQLQGAVSAAGPPGC